MTAQQRMFQAICDALGWDSATVTKTVASRIGKVASELNAVGATEEQVRAVPQLWSRIWGTGADQPTLTDTAIPAWWPAMMVEWKKLERAERQRLEEQAEEIEMIEDALPLEENRRRWREMMQGRSLKSI